MTFEELLSLSGINISEEQRAAIFSDTSTVVSAGAGSGKTTVLSLRFVRLVLSGKAHSDEILTLTFTKKAAAEMYERIYSLLVLAAADDPMVAEDLAEHFPKARISTMDSFWSEIARTDSLSFGVMRDFQSLEAEEGAAEDLVREVYESLQEEDELKEGFMILSSLYRNTELLDLFARIALEETDILTAFDRTKNASSYKAIIALLENRITSTASYIFRSLASLDEANPENGQHAEIQRALEAYSNGDYSALPGLNLNKLRKAADRELRDFIKENDCKAFFESLKALQALKETENEAEAVSSVIDSFVSRVQSRKRLLGMLTYRDTESMCREVLLTNLDVRDYYKSCFRYIMVDEFQDNNSRQRDLLYLLAERKDAHSASIPDVEDIERGKLFFVGDDKQSIYYFRGADVSVFRSLRSDIRKMGGVNLSLSANYRSEPALILHFNRVFESVFAAGPSDEDMESEAFMSTLTGVPYMSFHASSETIKAREAKAGVSPVIELYAIDSSAQGEGDASAEDSEALFIARRIAEMVGGDGYLIPDGKGGLRRPSYSDIAVLLRTTAPQMPIERAFRLCGIPYTVQESTSATIEGVGWDIYAFLQLLVYPEDRLSYMAVLRSPFARISDEGLLFLADDDSAAFASEPSFPSERDREAFENVRLLYCHLRGMVGRCRISQIISRLFHESGYSVYLHSSPYLEAYEEHFSYLWAAAELFDGSGRPLTAFLDYLRPLIGQAGKLRNASVQHLEMDGVQIMTIHRSKGLQFPIVFLADADHGSGNQEGRNHLVVLDGKYPCIMPDLTEGCQNLILHELALFRQRRENAELRRLLYVALTRAVDHIVVTAHMRKRHTGISLLDIYREGCQAEACEIPSAAEEEFFSRAGARSRDEWYQQPVLSAPGYSRRRFGVKDASRSEVQISGGEELPALVSDSVVAARNAYDAFGTIVHAALEAAVKGEQVLISFPPGFSEDEKAVISETVDGITSSFLSSEFYASVIAGRRTETEVRFYYPMNDGVGEGSADLLVFGKEWNLVVDYKTDRYMNEEQHRGQVTAYAAAMEELYKKKCLAVLLYVRGWKAGTLIDANGNAVTGISLL